MSLVQSKTRKCIIYLNTPTRQCHQKSSRRIHYWRHRGGALCPVPSPYRDLLTWDRSWCSTPRVGCSHLVPAQPMWYPHAHHWATAGCKPWTPQLRKWCAWPAVYPLCVGSKPQPLPLIPHLSFPRVLHFSLAAQLPIPTVGGWVCSRSRRAFPSDLWALAC